MNRSLVNCLFSFLIIKFALVYEINYICLQIKCTLKTQKFVAILFNLKKSDEAFLIKIKNKMSIDIRWVKILLENCPITIKNNTNKNMNSRLYHSLQFDFEHISKLC